MRIVVHGQQAFGSAVLERLLSNNEDIVSVCAAPNKKNGNLDPLVEAANANNIPVHQPTSWKTDEAYELMESFDADLCVMAYVTLIVPSAILNLPRKGSIQYHPSLLPMHRGPSSINWPISMGSKKTGITIFWPDDGLDTGPILLQKECSIDENETLGALYFNKLFPMGVDSIEESIQLIKSGDAPKIDQNLDDGSYESWFGREQSKIDWSKHANEIHALIRASDPQPGAWTLHNGNEIMLYDVKIINDHQNLPGYICNIDKEVGIQISTGHGTISIQKFRHNGKKMNAMEYAEISNMKSGDILGN